MSYRRQLEPFPIIHLTEIEERVGIQRRRFSTTLQWYFQYDQDRAGQKHRWL
jgi:hypothetical protein